MAANTRKPVVLIAIAIVFFLAAGTFGALWLIERGNHAITSQRLTDARTKTENVQAKATSTEQQADAGDSEYDDLDLKLKLSESRSFQFGGCADQAREFTKTMDSQRAEDLDDTMWKCWTGR